MGIGDNIDVLIVIGVIVTIWVIFNEFIFRLSDVASTLAAGTPGVNVMALCINLWRLFPFVVVIGALLWSLLKSTQDEPYTYPSQA
jgi:hypothetical protein